MRIEAVELTATTLDGHEVEPYRELRIDGTERDVEVRVVRHFAQVPGIEVNGTEVDADFYFNGIPVCSSKDRWSAL